MKNYNLYRLFQSRFSREMDKVVLTTESGAQYTYRELHHRSAQYANYLRRYGIKPGDRVLVQVEKSPENLFCYLGCLRAGTVYVPLNPAYQQSELAYFMEDAEPALFICDPAKEAVAELGAGNRLQIETLDAQGRGTLYERSLDEPDNFETASSAVDDTAVILYTSGTTGKPKGAMLIHGNLAANGDTLQRLWGFTANDVLLHMLPIFHVHGLFFASHCVLLSASSMVFLPKFSVDYVEQYLPLSTMMMGVPTYYTRMLADARFTRELCRNTRLFVSGSAPLLEQTFTEFHQHTGETILERYGMTETGINTSNPLVGPRKPRTVGLPLPGVRVRIVDDADRPLEVDEIGHIQVKGANVFKGYWRMPEKTAEDFTADGFFRTGDTGSVDADGYLTISGRARDLIITGGLNVYPKEIELLLDSVDGVIESAVIGLPHADYGEAVTAVVCKRSDSDVTEAQLINALRNTIAHFKVPKKVFFIDELPRNTMGKVQKNLLRERFKDAYQPLGTPG
ncbi:MAG: malonate--CoA ligase [Armatimonadota bacterium]